MPSITARSRSAALMAWLAACTTAIGVLAGAWKPNHSSVVSSPKPCSAKVATSGAKGRRARPEKARMRSLPARWLARKSPPGVNMQAIWPPTTSVMPGTLPR